MGHRGPRPGGIAGRGEPGPIDELAANNEFLERLDRLSSDLNGYLTKPLWYQELQARGDHGAADRQRYFSMEFGVAEVLPIYSGSVGILAQATTSRPPPTWDCR